MQSSSHIIIIIFPGELCLVTILIQLSILQSKATMLRIQLRRGMKSITILIVRLNFVITVILKFFLVMKILFQNTFNKL